MDNRYVFSVTRRTLPPPMRSLRDLYEAVHEIVFASALFAITVLVGVALVVVAGPLYLLGFSEQTAGYVAAAIVGVGGLGAIMYGGYSMIDWG